MIGDPKKKIAEEAFVEMLQRGQPPRGSSRTRLDEILQLRLRALLVGHERRLRQAAEEGGLSNPARGVSSCFLRRPECSRRGAGGNRKMPLCFSCRPAQAAGCSGGCGSSMAVSGRPRTTRRPGCVVLQPQRSAMEPGHGSREAQA